MRGGPFILNAEGTWDDVSRVRAGSKDLPLACSRLQTDQGAGGSLKTGQGAQWGLLFLVLREGKLGLREVNSPAQGPPS